MTTKPDNRVSQRFQFRNERICFIEIEGIGKVCPTNLSYGGFGLDETGNMFVKEEKNQKYNIVVSLVGKKIPGQAILAYNSPKSVGFSFVHETTDLLIELSRVIDKMRVGSTLELIPENLRKELYRDASWKCWHGDGPTDLRIKRNGEKLVEAILSFRIGETYYDLLFSATGVTLRNAIDTEGVAARMATSAQIESSVAAQALSILIGFLQNSKNESQSDLVDIILNAK